MSEAGVAFIHEAVSAGDKSRVLAYLIRFGSNHIEVIGEPA